MLPWSNQKGLLLIFMSIFKEGNTWKNESKRSATKCGEE